MWVLAFWLMRFWIPPSPLLECQEIELDLEWPLPHLELFVKVKVSASGEMPEEKSPLGGGISASAAR